MNRAILSLYLLFLSTCIQAQLESKKNETGKYGFTNEAGDWIIQPIYKEVVEFYELSYTFAKLKDKWGIIDQQGKTILPFEYSKINNLDIDATQLYSAVKNNRYGLISLTTAMPVTEFVYENDFYFDDGVIFELGALAVVQKNKKTGLINKKGVEVIPCIYDSGKNPFTSLDYNFYLVKQNGKEGVIDTLGTQIVLCRYDKVRISDSLEDTFEIIKGSKYGLCDFKGTEIIAPVYDKAFYFEGDYAIARLKGKYGIINRKGETVKPFTYLKESDAFDEFMKLFEN